MFPHYAQHSTLIIKIKIKKSREIRGFLDDIQYKNFIENVLMNMPPMAGMV
jgi:hypothetical protein